MIGNVLASDLSSAKPVPDGKGHSMPQLLCLQAAKEAAKWRLREQAAVVVAETKVKGALAGAFYGVADAEWLRLC